MKTKLLFTALVFVAATTLAAAQTQGSTGQGRVQRDGKGNGAAFVDNNKNGVCDNYENGIPRQGMGKNNGNRNGQGHHRGNGRNGNATAQGCGQHGNYVDENKNGVCDYRETNATKKQ